MSNAQSLSHTKWECKYHLTWIPKYRRKELYGDLRKHLGEVFRELARRKESEILEGHLMPDHAHMLIVEGRNRLTSQVYCLTLEGTKIESPAPRSRIPNH